MTLSSLPYRAASRNRMLLSLWGKKVGDADISAPCMKPSKPARRSRYQAVDATRTIEARAAIASPAPTRSDRIWRARLLS